MKKILALLLVAMMLFAFAACSDIENPKTSQQPDQSADPDKTAAPNTGNEASNGLPSGDSYAEAYTFYSGLVDKLGSTISNIVDNNNARLEEEQPDTYFDDPSYMIIIYMPFLSIDMAFTSSVSETVDPASIVMAYSFMGIEDAEFTITSPGNYKISYTSEDWETGEAESIEELMRYDNGSIRYEQRINGELDEYYEFVALGQDRYALQSKTNRAIVTYKDGKITEVLHSWTKYEEDWETGELTEWSVWYDPEADSIWGKSGIDESWVLELESEGALERIYELKDGVLTISGQTSNTDWETGVTTFEPMEPVIIAPREE